MAFFKELIVKITGDSSGLRKATNDAHKEVSTFDKGLAKIGAGMAAAFSIGAAVNFGKQMIAVRSEFEKYEAVLRTTLGSSKAAASAMSMLQGFAAKTPFQLNELTDSYVKLANRGLKPTEAQLTSLGDLASSTGKSFGQLAEAMLDSMTGENERLKEFGIIAKDAGNKTAFTFKGVTTEVDKTADAISNYIVGLGQLKGVTGSMASISETMVGKISNMKDAWDAFLNSLGKSTSGVISGVIKTLNNLFTAMTRANDFKNEAYKEKFQIKIETAQIDFAKSMSSNPTEFREYLKMGIAAIEDAQKGYDEIEKKSKEKKLGGIGGFKASKQEREAAEQQAQANRDATVSLKEYLTNEELVTEVFKKAVPVKKAYLQILQDEVVVLQKHQIAAGVTEAEAKADQVKIDAKNKQIAQITEYGKSLGKEAMLTKQIADLNLIYDNTKDRAKQEEIRTTIGLLQRRVDIEKQIKGESIAPPGSEYFPTIKSTKFPAKIRDFAREASDKIQIEKNLPLVQLNVPEGKSMFEPRLAQFEYLNDAKDKTDALAQSQENLRDKLIEVGNSLIQGADNWEDFGKMALNAIKSAIAGIIALGVANAIEKTLAGPAGKLGPIGVGIAALAGGLAAGAFSTLVPSFAGGGVVNGPTIAMIGDNPGRKEAVIPSEMWGQMGGGRLSVEVTGRALKFVLDQENGVQTRTGG